MLSFAPHYLFQNPHLQTYLGASEFRHQWVMHRARNLVKNSETVLIKTPDEVRLQVEFAKAKNSNGKLAILFHGWEGSANSAYLLGCGQVLFDMGYNVARLNFRDHGDTHHLNQSPFNSVRLDEICEAIISLSQRYSNKGVLLLGFSLGGNFALRLSSYHKLHDIQIEKTIAICPAIDPVHISRTIEQGSPLYHNFFLKKWRESLSKKYRYYPEMMRSLNDLKVKRLHKMNEVFVPLHTPFETTDDYLAAYQVTQKTLNGIKNSCDIIYSDDDPIIHASVYDNLEPTAQVKIHAQNYGGHCAFLEDWSLNSWIERILPLVLSDKTPTGKTADENTATERLAG